MADSTKLPKKGLFREIGERLNGIFKYYIRDKTKSTPNIYNESKKILDLTKLIPEDELRRTLETISSRFCLGFKTIIFFF
jgi:hypothetical protein